MSARIDVLHPLHECFEALGIAVALRELPEPFPKGLVEGPPLRLGNGASLFDEILVRTESDVFHATIVYTNFVQSILRPLKATYRSDTRNQPFSPAMSTAVAHDSPFSHAGLTNSPIFFGLLVNMTRGITAKLS